MAFQEHREDRRARFDRWVIVPASAAAFAGLAGSVLAGAVFGFARGADSFGTSDLIAIVAASVALLIAVGVAMREDRRKGKRD